MVVLPSLKSALVGAMLLSFAVVMGEFTFANVLLFHTFAVLINEVGQNAPTEAAALSTLSFLITWVVMLGVLTLGRGDAQLGGAR
jgi:putative spermidine/putrescine transport system permease protein